HGVLPLGIGPHGCCWGTWLVLVLPFIEQDAAYRYYQNWGGTDATGPRYGGGNNSTYVTNQRYSMMTCPADVATVSWNITHHNYVANFGNTGVDWQDGSAGKAPFDEYRQVPNLGGVVFGGAPFIASGQTVA